MEGIFAGLGLMPGAAVAAMQAAAHSLLRDRSTLGGYRYGDVLPGIPCGG